MVDTGIFFYAVRQRSFRFRIEIAAIVEETIIIRLYIFLRPILGGKLTVGVVFRGNVISCIVMEKTGNRASANTVPTWTGTSKGCFGTRGG